MNYSLQSFRRDILDEAYRQIEKFPEEHDPMGRWISPNYERVTIITEEVGEIARACLEKDYDNLRVELIQTATLCYKWLESLN